MILVGHYSMKALRDHNARKIKQKIVSSLDAQLRGNNFTYDKLEVTYARNLSAGMNEFYFRAKNFSHPNLGSTRPNEWAEISATFKDNADNVYRFQNFKILRPKRMATNDWY
jgi:hypothetical protein